MFYCPAILTLLSSFINDFHSAHIYILLQTYLLDSDKNGVKVLLYSLAKLDGLPHT